MDSIVDRLILTAGQLDHLVDTVRDVRPAPEDMPAIAEFLRVLGECGQVLAKLALNAVDRAGPGHPVRSIERGGCEVQVYIGHAGALLMAVETFAGDAGQLLKKMPRA